MSVGVREERIPYTLAYTVYQFIKTLHIYLRSSERKKSDAFA